MFWITIIGLGGAWVLQSALSFRQMQAFSKQFVEMRKQGRVSLGKFQGAVVSGSIVMFALDDQGRIRYGRRLRGVTVMARFRDFDTFDGQTISDIDPNDAQKAGRSVVKAVTNARDNYRVVMSGGEAIEPPTPLGRMLAAPRKLRRKAGAEATTPTQPITTKRTNQPPAATPSKMRRKVVPARTN